MTAPTPPVALKACPVIQADRDAAAALIRKGRLSLKGMVAADMEEGRADDSDVVQAFAAHRVATPDAAAMRVPDGFALVPVVPTEAMCRAMDAEHSRQLAEYDLSQPFDYHLTWSAMLAAAPASTEAGIGAGEGEKAYRCRGCGWRGSEPIANGHPQNGCDLELMVHDPVAYTPKPPAALDEQRAFYNHSYGPDRRVAVMDASGSEVATCATITEANQVCDALLATSPRAAGEDRLREAIAADAESEAAEYTIAQARATERGDNDEKRYRMGQKDALLFLADRIRAALRSFDAEAGRG